MLTVDQISLLRKYIGKLLASYSIRFDDDLLSEIQSEILISLERRGYEEKFKNSMSTMLYLEARSGIGNHYQRDKTLKRTEDPAMPYRIDQPPFDPTYSRLDQRIDLKGFQELLTEDERLIISYYEKGYDYPEISGETGLAMPTIEKKMQDVRVYAAQYFDMPNRGVLYAQFQSRLDSKRDRDTKARLKKSVIKS
jgi:DNA-directed RNA polymerase specialized sigma24 family protein